MPGIVRTADAHAVRIGAPPAAILVKSDASASANLDARLASLGRRTRPSPLMFESMLHQLVRGARGIKERSEGVAFLRAAKSAYPISAISYVALNIPLRSHKDRFVQCALADSWAKHCVSREPLRVEE